MIQLLLKYVAQAVAASRTDRHHPLQIGASYDQLGKGAGQVGGTTLELADQVIGSQVAAAANLAGVPAVFVKRLGRPGARLAERGVHQAGDRLQGAAQVRQEVVRGPAGIAGR